MSNCKDLAVKEHFNSGQSRQYIADCLCLPLAEVNMIISKLGLRNNRKVPNPIAPEVRRTIEDHQERLHERELQGM